MSCKKVPHGSENPTLPYSTVLEIECSKLVVICGQVSEDEDGNILGENIEQQTRQTLINCQKQLALASCTMNDVFKVNIYIKHIDDWSKLNTVYRDFFKPPMPVRATVQAGLLEGFLVEIEMWAAKK
ncbi:MAG: RidA family protein [Spirochaetia bacterium]